MRPDGGATLFVGSTEIGQGMTTAFAQLVATELGIAVDQVDVPTPDTQSSPFDSGTEASRTLALVGNAVVSAASAARARLLSAFRSLHGLDGDAGSVEAGIVSASGRSSSIADVMRALSPEEREQIVGAGRFDPPVGTNVQGGFTTFWEPGVAAARVRVDVDTGAIEVLNYISVLDAGRAINPKLCEGQDLGAVMMALGHALTERLEYDQGRMLNASLVDYRLPGFGDMPDELETILIERGDGPGPHGSRGVGEAGSLAVGPVLANAVAHALGIRLLALPLTPEAVWRALGERVAAGARTS